MGTMIKFLLSAAALVAGVPAANAANFVTYSVNGSTTGAFTGLYPRQFQAVFTLNVDEFQGDGTYALQLDSSAFGYGETSVGVSQGRLNFNRRVEGGRSGFVNLNACFLNPISVLPTAAGLIGVDRSCSDARIRIEGVAGYDFTDVTGVVEGITVATSTSATSGTGLTRFTISAPVPEPATWALMLAGFGMVGYTMRKRSCRTRVVYA